MKVFNGYQCFHCLSNSVGWTADFSFEDYGYDGEGIIHNCRCYNCKAVITYFIPLDKEATEYLGEEWEEKNEV